MPSPGGRDPYKVGTNMDKAMWATIPFQYGNSFLDRGQVIDKLSGQRNDEKLVRMRYLAPVEDGVSVCTCALCGSKFIGEGFRERHGNMRHVTLSEEEKDRLAERIDQEIIRDMPLDLSKTLASQR